MTREAQFATAELTGLRRVGSACNKLPGSSGRKYLAGLSSSATAATVGRTRTDARLPAFCITPVLVHRAQTVSSRLISF
jgi:hypothetical protein